VSGPIILSIESSCDETGIALISGERRILSNVVASQVALHAPSGGIVPEVAARAHLRWIVPVLDEAWNDAGVAWSDVDGIAVTYGPGLAGSLLVGINFAKALSWVHDVPLIAVNHLEGHVYAAWLLDPGEDEATRPEPVFPLVALVVSGGHTFLAEMRDHLTYRLLGTTVDDAAGEAFDKVGRLLGLGYPGGPEIQRAAEGAVHRDTRFPRAWMGDSYDWSFSGLKTAARKIVAEARAGEGLPPDGEEPLSVASVAELAWGFQDSVVDVLVTKTIRAAEAVGARSIVLVGGVAANSVLRDRLRSEAEARSLPLIVPRPGLCTDNGAMIGAAGVRRFLAGERARMDLDARPSLPLATREPIGAASTARG
jgi:N6-L-threonylcarbamoyladenine synthase